MTPTPRRAGDVRLRVAAIGDPHLAESEFPWLLPVWDAVVDRIEEARPDIIVLTGDLFGGRDANHLMTIGERHELPGRLRRLSNIAPVIIVKGNHDHPREFRWLESLSGRHRIRAFDEPGLHTVGGATIYALPYPDKGALLGGETFASIDAEREAMIEALAARLRSLADYVPTWRRENPGRPFIVVSHGTPSGTTGDGTELYRPGGDITMEPALMESVGADLWLNGHIHTPFQLWGRGFDLGSFYPGGFGEGGGDRFWWLFDLGMTSQALPSEPVRFALLQGLSSSGGYTAPGVAYRFPTGAPRRVTVSVAWDGAEAKAGFSNPPKNIDGVHVRIVVEADERDEATIPWDRLEADAQECGALSVTRAPKIHRVPREVRAPALAKAANDLDRLAAWVETTGATVDEVQRLRLREAIDDPGRDRVARLMENHKTLAGRIAFAAGREG